MDGSLVLVREYRGRHCGLRVGYPRQSKLLAENRRASAYCKRSSASWRNRSATSWTFSGWSITKCPTFGTIVSVAPGISLSEPLAHFQAQQTVLVAVPDVNGNAGFARSAASLGSTALVMASIADSGLRKEALGPVDPRRSGPTGYPAFRGRERRGFQLGRRTRHSSAFGRREGKGNLLGLTTVVTHAAVAFTSPSVPDLPSRRTRRHVVSRGRRRIPATH